MTFVWLPLLMGVVLFFAGVWLLWPMRRKPLYSDDGVWLYYAVFRHRGLRLFENYKNGLSYFGVEWLMAALYRLFRRPGPRFFYDVKSVWYALTACALYLLGWLLTDDVGASLAAGVTLLLVMAHPRTKFALTFADQMLVLPVLLAASAAWLGAQTGDWWWLAAAGVLAGWATQMKIIALLPALALLAVFGWAPSFWSASGWYALGFAAMNLVLPCVFLVSPKRAVLYLGTNLIGLLQYTQMALGMLHIRAAWLSKIASAISMWLRTRVLRLPAASEQKGAKYVEKRLGKPLKAVWGEFIGSFWPLLARTALVWPLLLAYLVDTCLRFDAAHALMTALFFSLWATQLVQKSFFPCHVNQVWPPVLLASSLVVSNAIGALLAVGNISGVVGIALMVVTQWLVLLIPALRHRRETTLADYPESFAARFAAAETVGDYIRQHSQSDDRLLVWGNMPSIYIYAQREICMPRQFKKQMFTHIHPVRHGEVHAGIQGLLDHMRLAPPQWICWFTFKDDGWNIERIGRETGAPYKLHGVVEHPFGSGGVLRVPVYRRDDRRLRETLLELWRIGDSTDAATRFHSAFPRDGELALRQVLAAMPDTTAAMQHLRSLQPQSDSERFSRNLLLAELQRDSGALPQARESFAMMLSEHEDSLPVLLGLAETLFMQGEVREALSFVQRAMRVNPQSAEACNDAGVMLHSVGETEQARQCFERALQLLPNYEAARENLRRL